MQRDLDLIRDLLIRVEERAGPPFDFEVEGATEEEVEYHLALLVDGSYLDGEVLRIGDYDPGTTNVDDVRIRGLTWQGHDLLDAIRDDSVWAEVKKKVGSAVGSTSIAVMKQLAVEYAKSRLDLGG